MRCMRLFSADTVMKLSRSSMPQRDSSMIEYVCDDSK